MFEGAETVERPQEIALKEAGRCDDLCGVQIVRRQRHW